MNRTDPKSTNKRAAGGELVALIRPGIYWAVPAIVFFAFFALIPLILVVAMSLVDWGGLGDPIFVGADNWRKLVRDEQLAESVVIMLLLSALGILGQVPMSMLLGVWAAGYQRNRAILSAIYMIPLLLSSAAVAIVWKALLDPNFGLPGQWSEYFGGDGSVLGTRTGAIAALVFVGMWQYTPFHTLIYQGAARAIPISLYQAAAIDGAGRYRQLVHITVPQLRNTIVTSTILMIAGGLTGFETVLILTSGGPGTSTTTTPLYMFQTAFARFDYGYGSTIAVVLVVLSAAISITMVRLTKYDRMQSEQEGI